MQFIKMNCNNCNAQLDIDLDNLQVFCPYCGQKLMMDFDQLAWVLAEKEKTKRAANREIYQTVRAANREEHQTARTKMAFDYESREKDKDWRKKVITAVGKAIAAVGVVLVFFYIFYYAPRHMFDPEKKEHDQRVEYLNQLELEIEADIKAEDYDSALIKANKLYCDDHWSNEQTAAWDAKREAYIKIIEEKKRQRDLKDPNNIFMPDASSSFKGKNYSDIVDQLNGLGFTNISTQVASKSPGLFDKTDTVEHILVGGKTEFATGDYFNKDTPIIIYYYSK